MLVYQRVATRWLADLPMKNGDVPVRKLFVYQRVETLRNMERYSEIWRNCGTKYAEICKDIQKWKRLANMWKITGTFIKWRL